MRQTRLIRFVFIRVLWHHKCAYEF